jgi:ABC-type oligopeptide transport system ATPase subunit
VLHRGRIVEDGLTQQIVAKPQHPYTRRLIESVPVIDIRHPNRPAPLARS